VREGRLWVIREEDRIEPCEGNERRERRKKLDNSFLVTITSDDIF